MHPLILLSLFAAAVSSAADPTFAAAAAPPIGDAYAVPAFDLSDLRTGRRRDDLAAALGTTGLLAVTLGGDGGGIPAVAALGRDRDAALGGLCRCAAPGVDGSSSSSPSPSLLASVPGSDSALLSDGETRRTTVATATVGEAPLPLPREELTSACGGAAGDETVMDAMDSLRDVVADVSATFVGAVDGLLRDAACATAGASASHPSSLLKTDRGASYNTIASIVAASRNLEHFHVYSKESKERKGHVLGGADQADDNDDANDTNDDVLRLHTDAGLFLAFIPGMSCLSAATGHHLPQSDDGSFFVLDPTDGVTKRAVFPSQPTVAIMLGVGAERWLNVPTVPTIASETPLVTLKATRHSVKMRRGERRAWYGMMHLVPDSAIVQAQPRRTFADMRKSVVRTSKEMKSRRYGDDIDGNDVDVAVGCGVSPPEEAHLSSPSGHAPTSPRRSRRRLQHVVDGSACNNVTNFYCWMSCLEIPDAEHAVGHLREGHSLYCLDPAVLVGSGNRVSSAVEQCEDSSTGRPGGAMNPGCVGAWQPTAPGVPSQKVNVDHNEGGQEDQYCYGVTSMYMQGFEWKGTQCIVYLFKSWVLNTPGKFTAAALGTIAFGIALEGAIHLRRTLLAKHQPASTAGGSATSSLGRYLALSAGTYLVQLTMGYLLMLVVMTYSAPLFICVVLGLAGGHLLFVVVARRRRSCASTSSETGENSADSVRYAIPEGLTPCCQNSLINPTVVAPTCEENDVCSRGAAEAASPFEKSEEPFCNEGTCCRTSEGTDSV